MAQLRINCEQTALNLVTQDHSNVGILRFPPTVHGTNDTGFIQQIVKAAKKSGRCAYVGNGGNVWPAVHVLDAAVAISKILVTHPSESGSIYNIVAETGIEWNRISAAISNKYGIPSVSLTQQQANTDYGFLGQFVSLNNPTDNSQTKHHLNWQPQQIGLLEDIKLNY